jgi:hypothetical protein
MIRAVLVASICLVVACVASAQNPKQANAASKPAGWAGDPCSYSRDCNTLWCVNGVCTVRDP